MKLFFVKGQNGYDEEDPILVLADTKEEAEELVKPIKKEPYRTEFPGEIFRENTPNELGKAGEGYELRKGIIWKQFNAG